jgi:uncharacterized membrane protein
MKSTKHLINATVTSILALGAASNSIAVPDQPQEWEKCAGVAKSGKNDCAAIDSSHGCAGMSKKDGGKKDWIWVPAGTCEKIVGGEAISKEPAKG